MSPKTARSHQEHWHRKKYFTLFNIFHQIILKQFTKVVAIPIIQMGEQRHKLTLQFSLHHWSADNSMHHVSWPQPSLEPRDSSSSLGKAFHLLNVTQQIQMGIGSWMVVWVHQCVCTSYLSPLSHPWETKHFIHTVLAKPRICSQAPEWQREEAAPLPFTRGKRPSDRTYRALALEYSKTPQSPRAERKGTQDWILLNLSPGKEESQLFF